LSAPECKTFIELRRVPHYSLPSARYCWEFVNAKNFISRLGILAH
jgi:hypothetical protein